MTKAEWFALYSQSHRNPLNRKIHKVCVPLIVYAQTGLLFSIPSPSFWQAGWPGFYATLELLLALTFYMRWGDWKLPGIMFSLYVIPNLSFWNWLEGAAPQAVLPLASAVFVLAWIGQFVGHKIEGRKPSFLQDLQFLLVGPAWVLRE